MELKTIVPRPRTRELLPLANLRDEMDRLFESWTASFEMEPFFRPLLRPELAETFFHPRLDVVETDKGLALRAELPGIEETDVEIELMKDRIVLKGEKKLAKEEKKEGYYRKECQFGAFYREVPLPWEVDTEKVAAAASFKNGVLTVDVPKPKELEAGKRKIAIHA